MEFYLVVEKNEFMSFARKWAELEVMLSEISQTQTNTKNFLS
jgi:hypothetical protein